MIKMVRLCGCIAVVRKLVNQQESKISLLHIVVVIAHVGYNGLLDECGTVTVQYRLF